MKRFIIVFALAGALSGCTLPEKAYHLPKAAAIRRSAIPLAQLDSIIQFSAQVSQGWANRPDKKVVILARGPFQPGSAYVSMLAPDVRQVIEGKFTQGLMQKGYRVASRLNDQPVSIEQAYPLGDTANPRAMFKGHLLLIVTVTQFSTRAEDYVWEGKVWSETYRRPVGTQATVALTVELLDAESSETYWSANASLDALLAAKPSSTSVLESFIRYVAARLPARPSAPASNQ
jgi:hypothetical protein